MATEVIFGGKRIGLPGAYATIVSGQQSAPLNLDYGRVVVIDTGAGGPEWGGGSGIKGELATGKDSIYTFDNLEDYQSFLKGGVYWKMAEVLFRPDPLQAAPGVSQVWHVKAAETVAAVGTFNAAGGGPNGGTFKFKVRDEGIIGNGVLTGQHLDKGYAYSIESGIDDPAKWIFKIWVGSWKGDHTDGLSYNEVSKEDSEAILLASSPEFNNIQELIDWSNDDRGFNRYFAPDATSVVTGDGSVDAADIAALSGLQVCSGGTETYDSARLAEVLIALQDELFTFVISDRYGVSDYTSALNDQIIVSMKNDQKYDRFLFIGGGADELEFSGANGSLDMGGYFDNDLVHVVHGEFGTASELTGTGFRYWPTIISAAWIVGRTAGRPPQVPVTNKSLGISTLKHKLTEPDQKRALDAGIIVVHLNKFTNQFVPVQGVNTLQDNKILFNSKGESHQISFKRIIAQINSELVVNAQTSLLNDENGVNANTLSRGRIKNFTETYLESRLAKPDLDNLLLDYRNVNARREGDVWYVTYEIVVNNEITKIFFTGFLFS